jgi:hypothetical protein
MPDGADALGLPVKLEFEGRVYEFAPMDNLEVVANFETYMEEQAWRAVLRAERWLPPEKFAEQMEGVRRDAAAGVFNYGTPGWKSAIQSVYHQKHLVWVMLTQIKEQRHTEKAVVDRLFKDGDKLRELMTKFGWTDPNAPASLTPGTT